MTDRKNNEAVEEAFDASLVDELSVADWEARLRRRFPELLRVRRMSISFGIAPGWRCLVEETLERLQRNAQTDTTERSSGPTSPRVPPLNALDQIGDVLLIQMQEGGSTAAQATYTAMTRSLVICQGCGEEEPLEPCEVEVDEPFRGCVTRTRRLCERCRERQQGPADPAWSLQVMTSITPGGDRWQRDTLRAYEKALVRQRTPVAGIPDLAAMRASLDRAFPWLAKLTRRLLNDLAARAMGNGWFKLPALLLSGPPGIGKTSYVQRLAELTGAPFRVLPLGGEATSMLIKGSPRGWASARPSAVLELIQETGVANPIVVLDELDKAGGSDWNGDLRAALLPFLEPSTAANYVDGCLGGADLSWVSFIATANRTAWMPQELLSRLEVIEVPPPRREDYPAIVEATVATFAQRRGLPPEMVPRLGPAEWAFLERFFTSPRKAGRATEELLAALLTEPRLSATPIQ